MACQRWCDTYSPHDACARFVGDTGTVSVGLIQFPAWPAPAVQVAYGDDEAGPGVFIPLPDAPSVHALMTGLGHPDVATLIATAVRQAQR